MCFGEKLDNTIENGEETMAFPEGGIAPFKGQKGEAWEVGYPAPCVIRWAGQIKPGTLCTEMFAPFDGMPH